MNNLARRYFMGGGKVIDPTESFIITVDVGAGDTFTLPLVSNGTYDFTADWGDGTSDQITTYNQTEITHTYSVAGSYDIDMNGVIEGWGRLASVDRSKILKVKQWGTVKFLNQPISFDGCINLDVTAQDIPDLTQSTDLAAFFRNCESLIGNSSFNNWDVSNVTSFSASGSAGMFEGCTNFNQNIGNWTINASAFRMKRMFLNSGFNNGGSPDIKNWNMSGVNDVNGMFRNSPFNQPINNWNASFQNMSNMFNNCPFDQNISSWDMSNVTSLFSTFENSGFNNGGSPDINNWNLGKCSDFVFTFRNNPSFNQPVGGWTLGTLVSSFDMAGMFRDATAFNQNVGTWDMSKCSRIGAPTSGMFLGATSFNNGGSSDINTWDITGLTEFSLRNVFNGCINFDQPLSNWDVTNVTNANGFLEGVTLSTANYDALLEGWESQLVQNDVSFNGGNSQYTIGTAAESARVNLINDHSWTITDGGGVLGADVTTFETESTSESQTFEVSLFSDGNYNFEVHWGDGTSNVITAYNDPNLIHTYSNIGNYNVGLSGTIDGIKIESQASNFNTASLKYIKQWGSAQNWAGFKSCINLLEDLSTDIPVSFRNNSMEDFFYLCQSFIGSSNINNWNVSGVTNFSQCFRGSSFNSNIENWDVSSATSLYGMFTNTPFNQPLNNWDVSNCLDFTGIFRLTSQFNQPLDLWVFNQINFVNLQGIFNNAQAFNNDSILQWDMSRVNNISFMFFGGNSVFNQPIGTWDISNVTTTVSMFQNNTAFNQDLSAWNVSNVTTMRNMFRSSNFNSNINGWNLTSCNNFFAMFFQTPFNQPLNLWTFNTSVNNIDFGSMLRDCPFNQDITGWDVSNVNAMDRMFQDNANFNQGIGTWNMSGVNTIEGMFRGSSQFNQPLDSWDVSNISVMFDVFNGNQYFNQPLNNWATNSLSKANRMFKNSVFNQDISNWVINSLETAVEMFEGGSLSTANYDALLIGWEAQKPSILQDVSLGVGTTQYTLGGAAETARANLTDPAQFNWTITDGGAI